MTRCPLTSHPCAHCVVQLAWHVCIHPSRVKERDTLPQTCPLPPDPRIRARGKAAARKMGIGFQSLLDALAGAERDAMQFNSIICEKCGVECELSIAVFAPDAKDVLR